MADRDFRISLDRLKVADLLGEISGPIKKRIENWWGEPLN